MSHTHHPDSHLRHLEEVKRIHADYLTDLAALHDFHSNLNEAKAAKRIREITLIYIERIVHFQGVGFCMVDEKDMSFRLIDSNPKSSHDLIQETIDCEILNGTFAWALRHNRAVTVRHSHHNHSSILHVLTTKSRVLGMFVGVLEGQDMKRANAYLNLLSIILLACAYALENLALHKKISEYNRNLEITVKKRTTELLKIHEELNQSQRLESVALLAGGIAHDFNNALMIIMGNFSIIKNSLDPSLQNYPKFGHIEIALQRVKDLTHQLLTFAKGGEPIRKRCSIISTIREAAEFAFRATKVQTVFDIPNESLQADIDEHQIRQVIIHLAVNALQAMQDKGTVHISVHLTDINKEHRLPLRHGQYLKIQIQDSGVGIPSASLAKIFDPYFTTKPGQGGLGLAIAYSIVKKHDGHITVHSKEGAGSTFSIYLPVASSQSDKKIEKILLPHPSHQSKKILVMDDDEAIRLLLKEMLQMIGYQVDVSRDGNEAITFYQKAKEISQPYAAVIMDLAIQNGIGGKEAIENLLAIDPEVKVIISSGHSPDFSIAEFKKYGFSGVIMKPYEIEELKCVLNEVFATCKK